MSTPPPSGNFYVQPPPSPRNNASGCWKAAGLTCGVLFLLALIGVIFVGRAVRENMAHPQRGSIMGTGVLAYRATKDGQTLQRAIADYQKTHGKYPNSLMDLVQEGRIDGKILHNDLDSNSSPGSISWQYIKPTPGEPGSTPLLTETYTVDAGNKNSSSAGSIIITLSGGISSSSNSASRQTFGTPPSGR